LETYHQINCSEHRHDLGKQLEFDLGYPVIGYRVILCLDVDLIAKPTSVNQAWRDDGKVAPQCIRCHCQAKILRDLSIVVLLPEIDLVNKR
jgi:hypothetical protein